VGGGGGGGGGALTSLEEWLSFQVLLIFFRHFHGKRSTAVVVLSQGRDGHHEILYTKTRTSEKGGAALYYIVRSSPSKWSSVRFEEHS
jgi:hypothetical protein